MWCELSATNQYKEPDMKSTTVAIDVAKDVLAPAAALNFAFAKLASTEALALSNWRLPTINCV
jgi:hypothetical protein